LFVIIIFFCELMFDNKIRSSFQNDDFENKEDLFERQHLSDVEMEKLRNVIKTKVADEFIISERFSNIFYSYA
jgi:hypothetical protein